jgi:hypothetical protein
MGVGPQQRRVREYQGQMPSPGRPTVAWREDRVRFWSAITRGLRSEEAAVEAGVSPPVGTRWFRHAGGVGPNLSPSVSGRYLSFAEREDIAVWRAQDVGVREIARAPVDAFVAAARGGCPYRTGDLVAISVHYSGNEHLRPCLSRTNTTSPRHEFNRSRNSKASPQRG